ncbi:RlpA-like double-psi beta-barrel-protein domain-containing protein-containing protein [Rhodotorula diobovata]|uniref:RlpA-like double-psi beta-barrel-protein domain-containing protein-containing protein n=1 Tax=Rhodotorula diobovata TaxID=5288 RepID=A0A5C5FUR2_9BASI|nr:RlpA-like double-psi beta-barrel-protein domain-containing protein-containing protein [Rhodotorula diobovata]
MGSYLYQSSTEEPSSGPASTVTATVGSAATTETAVASTSLSSTHAEPSPTAPVASSASSITDDAEEVTSGGGSHPSKAAATSSSAGGSKPSETSSAASAGETYSGKATWYMQRGVAGNCGTVNPESAMICALQTKLYADGKNCGRKRQLTRTDNGKSIVVTVADQCPTCVDSGYVDLSEGAYKELGTEDEGWFDMTWYFVD